MIIEIVDLAGDATTRGKAFGSARSRQIASFLGDWLKSLRAAGVTEPRSYITRMLQDTDFLPAIRLHTPELLDEVRGIAEGAGQPFDLTLGAQLMDEEWAYRPSAFSRGEALQKCSSVAIRSREGDVWIGQNMDLGGYTDGHQVALRIAPHSPECGALILTVGGMIALMGINAYGVGVCVNSLPQLPSDRKGLPVAFVIRTLLQSNNLAEAVRTVCAVPHATGQHYLLADATGLRSFEASAASVLEYHSPDPSRVLHTNHPLAQSTSVRYRMPYNVNSQARLRSLINRLMTGEADLEAIKSALSSCDDPQHPVCRLPASQLSAGTSLAGFTTGSMVSAILPRAQTIESWISAGPPTLRGYTQTRVPMSPAP